MGASHSSNNNTQSTTDYEKIVHMYKLPNQLSKEDFIRILACCDTDISEMIWHHHVGSEPHCSESKFNEIVSQCRFKSVETWLKYFLMVYGIGAKLNSDQMLQLLNSMSFSSEGLYPIISKSLPESDVDIIDSNQFVTWFERNLPEFGIDLSRYIHRTLSGQLLTECTSMKDSIVTILTELQSALISPSVMTLLCASLPVSYKTSDKREEFVYLNVASWTMLYSSERHGYSTSKFKENSFDYDGNLILLIKSETGLYCLASDVGLKEDWNAYGGIDARFLQLEPLFKKYVSGTRPAGDAKTGIIFSHFSAKSGRKGLFVGHNPPRNAAIEIDEDLSRISVLGKSEAIRLVEVWAVGSNVEAKLARLKDVRRWEDKEVSRHKNRKIKAEDWADSPDREILGMGGVNVRHADLVGGIDRDKDAQH